MSLFAIQLFQQKIVRKQTDHLLQNLSISSSYVLINLCLTKTIIHITLANRLLSSVNSSGENVFQNITENVFYFKLSVLHYISSFIALTTKRIFISIAFLASIFLSTIECFRVFENSRLRTNIQCCKLSDRKFNF